MVLGIDVSKVRLDYCLINRAQKIKLQGQCSNTIEGITAVLVSLKQKHPKLVVAVESTGILQQYAVAACHRLDITVRLINPIQTKQLTRASIRGSKTDTIDAFHIACLGLTGAGYVLQPIQPQLTQARSYMRLREGLVKELIKVKLMKRHMQDMLTELDTTSLQEVESVVSQTAQHYLEQATLALEVVNGKNLELLKTIPGLGNVTAVGVLTELGDVNRFSNAKSLIAYSGLDPRIKQSGNVHGTGKLTKRGSPHLRKHLFNAAAIARRFDPELKAVYEKKRAQGKSYTAATVHVARLLTNRIYAVLKRQSAYEISGKA